MTLSQIVVPITLGIIDGARRIIGDDAIKIANTVEGLKVTQNGEITITGNGMKILNKLIKAYEAELHGEIVLCLSVRMNVRTANSIEHK